MIVSPAVLRCTCRHATQASLFMLTYSPLSTSDGNCEHLYQLLYHDS